MSSNAPWHALAICSIVVLASAAAQREAPAPLAAAAALAAVLAAALASAAAAHQGGPPLRASGPGSAALPASRRSLIEVVDGALDSLAKSKEPRLFGGVRRWVGLPGADNHGPTTRGLPQIIRATVYGSIRVTLLRTTGRTAKTHTRVRLYHCHRGQSGGCIRAASR